MSKPIVLMALELEPRHKALGREKLETLASVHYFDELPEQEFHELVPEVEILVRYGIHKPYPDEVLSRMKKLRLIQVMSAGTQFLEVDPAIPDTVKIQGARGANSAAVAEQAMAHLLASAKTLSQHDRMIRSKLFDQRGTTQCLAESKIGIFGLGSIGAEIAKRALAFEMEVLAIDMVKSTPLPVSFLGGMEDIDRVLPEIDFLVLSLPLTDKTNGIIGSRELSLMKETGCLINVGRGALVHQGALYEHLVAHPRFCAGLDVWWKYPATYPTELIESHWDYPFDYPFHLLDNVTMTPHVAAYAGRARERMLNVVLENLIEYLKS